MTKLWNTINEWGDSRWIGIADDLETRVDLPDDSGEIKPTGDEGKLITPQNRWYCLRRDWTLTEVPARVPATIAAESKYWLWVNGKLVVFEGGLKRGPAPGAGYADEIDLAPYLVPGKNAIAVLLWHFGRQGFSHANSGRAGLLLRAVAGAEELATDASWRVAIHPAFSRSTAFVPNYRLPEASVRYDGRRDPGEWTVGLPETLEWRQADDLAAPLDEPFGPLVARPIPQWHRSDSLAFAEAPPLPWASTGETLSMAFPRNGHYHPLFRATVPPDRAGATITMITDHYHGGGPANIAAEYVCHEGVNEFECYGWINGHTLELKVPEGIRLEAVGFRETSYASEVAGGFSCDDESLNTLWQKACRTLQVCMRDTFMDCPDRERAQWWGDEVIQLHQCFYALDLHSHDLIRKGMLELAAWQRSDRSLYSPVPSGNWNRELPMQMLFSVGHGFLTYYLHTGDLDTIRAVLPAALSYIDLWEQADDGLAAHRPGEWTWGDWGPNKDLDLLYQGFYGWALTTLAELCDHAGNHEAAARLRARHARLHAVYDTCFWSEADAGYRGRNHDGPVDDRGQALAIIAGLAPEHRRPALTEQLRTQRYAGPYLEYAVDLALRRMGEDRLALDRMRERFGEMIRSPRTTLWEGWDIGSREYGGGTVNHAWSGGPLVSLSAGVAGVTPAEPGYARVRIAPRPGDLTRVEARLETVRGSISVEVDVAARTVTVNTPVRGELVFPPEWNAAPVPFEAGERVIVAG